MTLVNPQKRPFLAASTSFAGVFFGRTPEMQQIRRDIELLAETDLPVLLHGESGTGKTFVAELLHRQSRMRGGFLRLDCISGQDVASTLAKAVDFNDEETEFARFLEEGGTFLLDGIHELDLASQAVLLLLLKREVPSSSRTARTVRIVSTASVDLQGLAEEGRFRRDLLYHINAVKLDLLPLRRRPEDIKGLIDYYLDRYSREMVRPRPFLSAKTLDLMTSHTWPGNVRQLDNLVQSFITMGSEEVILRELTSQQSEPKVNWILDQIDISRPVALKEITRQITHDVERQIILKVLQANGWNRQKTARWLQISYRSLLYKLSDLSDDHTSNVHSLAPGKLRAANY